MVIYFTYTYTHTTC